MERLKESKNIEDYHEGQGQRWRGYGKTGEALDFDLLGGAIEIDKFWQAEMDRLYGQELDFTAFANVAERSSYWAQNALARAYEWALGDSSRRNIGLKLITSHLLKSIVKGIQRVQTEYPQYGADYVDLAQDMLAKAMEEVFQDQKIPNKREKWDLPQMMNVTAYTTSISMIAGKLGVPIDWVKTGMLEQISEFTEGHIREHGNRPTAWEVAEKFHIPQDTYERTFYKSWIDVIIDPENEVVKRDLRRGVREVVDGLPDVRRRQVIRLRFGFEDGQLMTCREVARRFGVTRERIRQIEGKALRSLRKPLVSYMVDQEQVEHLLMQLAFNDYVNAMYRGEYKLAAVHAKSLVSLYLASLTEVYDLGNGIENTEDLARKFRDETEFPIGKNKYVDELRYFWRMEDRVPSLVDES